VYLSTKKKMNNSKIWNSRMGHVGHNQLQQLAKMIDGMNTKLNNNKIEVCEICVSGKQTRMPHNQSRVKTRRPLGRIHSDLVGPIDPVPCNGNRYILTLLDDYNHFSVAFPMTSKADVLQYIKVYVEKATARFGSIICSFRCGNGREFCQRKSRIILEAKE
jgi:hypothetical protein